MRIQAKLVAIRIYFDVLGATSPAHAQQAEPDGWLGTEALKSRLGGFEFKNGDRIENAAQTLRDLQTPNPATTVYLPRLMRAGEVAYRDGLGAFGPTEPSAGSKECFP
jgi:hypothetical protein